MTFIRILKKNIFRNASSIFFKIRTHDLALVVVKIEDHEFACITGN